MQQILQQVLLKGKNIRKWKNKYYKIWFETPNMLLQLLKPNIIRSSRALTDFQTAQAIAGWKLSVGNSIVCKANSKTEFMIVREKNAYLCFPTFHKLVLNIDVIYHLLKKSLKKMVRENLMTHFMNYKPYTVW